MVHEGSDRIVDGAAVSRHDVSPVSPVALPLTTVPIGPDVGVSTKVAGGPADTVNVAVAVSPAGLPVTVTLYEPNADPGATVNDAVIAPRSTLHNGACNRVPGDEEIAQVVSLVAKLVPEIEITAPPLPELELSVIDGAGGTVNFALETMPLGVPVI